MDALVRYAIVKDDLQQLSNGSEESAPVHYSAHCTTPRKWIGTLTGGLNTTYHKGRADLNLNHDRVGVHLVEHLQGKQILVKGAVRKSREVMPYFNAKKQYLNDWSMNTEQWTLNEQKCITSSTLITSIF